MLHIRILPAIAIWTFEMFIWQGNIPQVDWFGMINEKLLYDI